ncbi:MAG: hypothetical protein IK013_02300 [Bacteroidales bacterium]|nr:hypothetical protein [Bacteroidales bacterium]
MKLTSHTETIAASAANTYDFLCHLIQTTQAPPIPDITDWHADEQGCSFTVKNMVSCNMRLTDAQPYRLVTYHLNTDKSISATVNFRIESMGTDSTLQVEAEADMPFWIQAMLKGPMEQVMNSVMGKLKEAIERS